MAESHQPEPMLYNPTDEIISPEAFVRLRLRNKLLDLEVYSVPPNGVFELPAFTIREVVLTEKGEAKDIDDGKKSPVIVKEYYRYEILSNGSRQYKCFTYRRDGKPQWVEFALGLNFDEPIASAMAHNDPTVEEITGLEQTEYRVLRCYRWPGDDLTVFSMEDKRYTRYSVRTSPRAASILYKIVSGDLRLQNPRKRFKALDQQGAREEDGFLPWATVMQEMYRTGSTLFQVIEIRNEVEGNTIKIYLRKSGPSSLWDNISPDNVPEKDPTKTNNYFLYVGSTAAKTRYHGSVWLQQNLPTANEDGDEYGSLREIVAHERLPRKWLREDTSRTLDDAFPTSEGTWRKLDTLHAMDQTFENITLWGCVNPEGLVIDRVVAKRFPNPNAFDKPAHLISTHVEDEQGILREIQRHEQLSVDKTVPIVALRGAAMRGGKKSRLGEKYIAFLEYCEGGDIDKIIRHYKPSDQFVPEIFIWLMFRNLVAACQHVETFDLNDPDIKPKNIFLRSRPSNDESYPAYYQPVLGDFGIMYPIDNVDLGGTLGFRAPESLEAELLQGGKNISGRMMHVFSIGLSVWSLMRKRIDGLGRPAGEQDPFLETTHTRGSQERQADPTAESSPYSARLERLVKECMAVVPSQRPTLVTLAGAVGAAIESWERRHPNSEKRQEHELHEWDRL